MKGQFKSNDCLELLSRKFNLFNVKLSTDLVCSITDSASVMEKIGNDSPTEHQLCFAHAIHLAIADVIYKKQDDNNNQNVTDEDLDDDSDENFDIFSDDNEDENEVIEQAPNLVLELHKVLVKVRKIVVAFKDQL